MQRVEQIAVQVAEANRLLKQGGVARWRIALVLLDGTAELLMKRACDRLLSDMAWTERHLEIVRQRISEGKKYEELPDWLQDDETPPRLLSSIEDSLKGQFATPEEIEKIESDFNKKVSYLIRNGYMTQSHATALKRLHKYRNEAQHEDTVRQNTVHEAAKIYIYVVCSMMKEFKTNSYSEPMPRDLAALLPAGTTPSFETQSLAADILLADSPVGTPKDLAETLSEHLVWRIEELLDFVDYLELGLPFETNTDTRNRNLKKIQVNWWTPAPRKVLDCRDIERWRRTAKGISRSTDYVKSFEKFASLEMAIEPLEQLVQSAVRALDSSIDLEVDRMRGR